MITSGVVRTAHGDAWQVEGRMREPLGGGVTEVRGARLMAAASIIRSGGQILAGMPTLAGIPAVLVHGRHDISSSLHTAWHIHRAWPGSELIVLGDAGHGGGSLAQTLTAAITRLGTVQL